MDTPLFQALYSLNKLDTRMVPSYAVDLLAQGLDSNSLRVLAGFSSDVDQTEINLYLTKAFRELKLGKIDQKEAGMIVAKDYARKIVSGELDPYEGARRIWWDVWNDCGEPDELASFVNDATDYEETYPKDTKILEEIVSDAKKLIEN